MTGPTDAIARLLDHQQISDVIYRYCRAADRLDAELIQSTFWEDGTFDGGPFEGPVLDVIPGFFKNVLRDMWVTSQHSVSNILIEFDGDKAHVEMYLTAFHLSHPNHESRAALIGEENVLARGFKGDDVIEFVLGARYIDVFERRNGEWRILRRKIVPEWSRAGLYTGTSTGAQYDMLRHRSSRDRSDHAYLR